MTTLQLATAASKLVAAPCEALFVGGVFLRCKRCGRNFNVDFIERCELRFEE
jgi:hypothetical protein